MHEAQHSRTLLRSNNLYDFLEDIDGMDATPKSIRMLQREDRSRYAESWGQCVDDLCYNIYAGLIKSLMYYSVAFLFEIRNDINSGT